MATSAIYGKAPLGCFKDRPLVSLAVRHQDLSSASGLGARSRRGRSAHATWLCSAAVPRPGISGHHHQLPHHQVGISQRFSQPMKSAGGRSLNSRVHSIHGFKDAGASFVDYYRLLDVAPDASREDIKRAYRFLQKRCHPDISGQELGHSMAVILNEAYATLTDPERRRLFDKDWRLRKGASSGYTGQALSAWAGSPNETRAIFVDEATCVGCHRCALEAGNTFAIEMRFGRARAVRQWGDPEESLEAAVSVCPVNCIHWVQREQLPALEHVMRREMVATQGTTDADPFYAAARFLQALEATGEVQDRNAAEVSIRMRAVGSSAWWHYARGGWRGSKGSGGSAGAIVPLARDRIRLPPYGNNGRLPEAVLEYLMAAAGLFSGNSLSDPQHHHHDGDEYWERLEGHSVPTRTAAAAAGSKGSPSSSGQSGKEATPGAEEEAAGHVYKGFVPQMQRQTRSRSSATSPLMAVVGITLVMLLANAPNQLQPVTAEECYYKGGGICRLHIKQ